MNILSWLINDICSYAVPRWRQHRRWFDKDKPDREALGYRAGLYPQEYSEADRERLGLRRPSRPHG